MIAITFLKSFKRFFLAALALTPIVTWASVEQKMTIDGLPSFNMDKGTYVACGITVRAWQELSEPVPQEIFVLNGSINVNVQDEVLGSAKAIVSGIKTRELVASNGKKHPDPKPLDSFWYKAPNSPATLPLNGKIMDGDGVGSRIYITSAESATGMISAIVDEKAIQFGFRLQGDSQDTVYFGPVSMKEDEKAQVLQCLSELMVSAKKKIEELEAAPRESPKQK